MRQLTRAAVTSATTYVATAWSLYRIYPAVAQDPATATLIGVSITSVFFLSAIAFALRRTSVVETSLMVRLPLRRRGGAASSFAQFAYITLSIFLLMPTALEDPALIQSFKATDPPLPPLLLQSFSAIVSFLSRTFGQGLDIISAACVCSHRGPSTMT
jgi:hypothetical protein